MNEGISQEAMMQRPLYLCHKEVFAHQIIAVRRDGVSGADLVIAEPYKPIEVEAEWLDKHNPKPGDYWVQYADGYTSVSPAEAFEDGYTLAMPKSGTPNRLLRWFTWAHLPLHLQLVSRLIARLAVLMDAILDEGAEKTAGLRKLLEAKDCFVRARLEMEDRRTAPKPGL